MLFASTLTFFGLQSVSQSRLVYTINILLCKVCAEPERILQRSHGMTLVPLVDQMAKGHCDVGNTHPS